MLAKPVMDRCVFCGATVTVDELVPLLNDEEAWRRIATEHHRDCEWVRTRAGRRSGKFHAGNKPHTRRQKKGH